MNSVTVTHCRNKPDQFFSPTSNVIGVENSRSVSGEPSIHAAFRGTAPGTYQDRFWSDESSHVDQVKLIAAGTVEKENSPVVAKVGSLSPFGRGD
jgi:hypothetical protein